MSERDATTEGYTPVPMRLPCPECGALHVDEGEFATKPHHTHACQECGEVWRPAVVATVGVRFLPGFLDDKPEEDMEVKGHKVFVFERGGWPWIEMVNDDRPLVRMTLQLLPDEARDIAQALLDTAHTADTADTAEMATGS